jgi:hypothetical protein
MAVRFQLVIDCTDPDRLARFWAAALGYQLEPPPAGFVWRATLSAAGLFAQLGATVPTRGFHLAYSPGFRGGILPGLATAAPHQPLRRTS